MDTVIVYGSFFIITFLGFVALRWFDRRLTFFFGLLFAAYVTLTPLVTGLPYFWGVLNLNPGYWNWAGKVYAIVFAAAVILGLGMNAKAIGLQLPKRNIKINLIAMILITLIYIVLGLIFEHHAPSGETITFQALMPSLAEELAFRGVAPALLLGLIYGKKPPHAMPWIVICIAAVPYGLVNSLGYSAGAFSFDWVHMSYTFAGGVAYGWMRFSTGSLLFPALDHGLANVAFSLMGFIDI
ncbi:MAG: CPBP family intramembrane glutamic endopeptidase [Gammaproteobacteria bacterium]